MSQSEGVQFNVFHISSDDYNRVLLSLDEGRSHDSDPDEDEEDESSDEEDEDSSRYINASHIDVGYNFQLNLISTLHWGFLSCKLCFFKRVCTCFLPHSGLLGPAYLHCCTDSTSRHHSWLLVHGPPEESFYYRHALRRQWRREGTDDLKCYKHPTYLLLVHVMGDSCVTSSSQESDGIYWDKDKKTFGDFEVEVASTDITPTFTTRNMLLRHVKVTREAEKSSLLQDVSVSTL